MKQEVVQNQNLLVIQGQGQGRQLYVKLLAGKEKQNYGLMQMNREIYLISHKLLLKNLHTLFPMILISDSQISKLKTSNYLAIYGCK